MKEFNKFKNLKFHSVIQQDILQAVSLLEKLGYEVGCDFSADAASKHNGVCAWGDGEITEGWLDYDNFEQVTLEELKEVVGETNKCNNNLSNNFTVTWEKVFGEKFVDSVIKAVKQNKGNNMKNDTFTLERLLGCEVKFVSPFGITHNGYIAKVRPSGIVCVNCDKFNGMVGVKNLTFFTEDGDELTFDEYVNMYYGDSL